jgi:hypothetical protein
MGLTANSPAGMDSCNWKLSLMVLFFYSSWLGGGAVSLPVTTVISSTELWMLLLLMVDVGNEFK